MYFFTLFYYIILQKLFAYCDELQVNKADRTEVCDELQVNKADRNDELRVNKAGIAEVDVVSLFFVNGSLSMLSVGNKYS